MAIQLARARAKARTRVQSPRPQDDRKEGGGSEGQSQGPGPEPTTTEPQGGGGGILTMEGGGLANLHPYIGTTDLLAVCTEDFWCSKAAPGSNASWRILAAF